MKRGLDGVYFRIGSENICFSDLTKEQMYEIMDGRSEEWLKSLCVHLGETIRELGDQFDIMCEQEELNVGFIRLYN